MSILKQKMKVSALVLAGLAPAVTTVSADETTETVTVDNTLNAVAETEPVVETVETPKTVEELSDTVIANVTKSIKDSKATTVAEVSSDVAKALDSEIASLDVTDEERKEITALVYDKIEQYSNVETDSDFMKALTEKINEVSKETTPTEDVPDVVKDLVPEPQLNEEIDTQAQTKVKTGVKVYTTQKEIDAKKGTYYYNKAKVKGTAVEIDEGEAKALGLSHSLLDDAKPETPAQTTSKPAETPKTTEKPKVASAQVQAAGPGLTRPTEKPVQTVATTQATTAPAQTTAPTTQATTASTVAPATPANNTTQNTQLPRTGESNTLGISFAGLLMLVTAGIILRKRNA